MMDGWLVGASTLKKLGMRGFARFFYIVALMSILVTCGEATQVQWIIIFLLLLRKSQFFDY